MSDITRYELTTETRRFYEDEFEVATMTESANGDYVSYDDHVNAVSQLQTIMREQEKSLKEAQALISGIASNISDNPVLVAKGYMKGIGKPTYNLSETQAQAIEYALNQWRHCSDSNLRTNLKYTADRIRTGDIKIE